MRIISDSVVCQCGSVENAQHFFFHCRNYHVPRTELLNTVSQYQTLSLSLLLYGNDSLSLETNTIIFQTVHKFILDSKRFLVIYYFGSTCGTIALCAAFAANLRPLSHPQLLCFHSFITSLSLSLSLSHPQFVFSGHFSVIKFHFLFLVFKTYTNIIIMYL